jgi:PAS domain S-box-containing protein
LAVLVAAVGCALSLTLGCFMAASEERLLTVQFRFDAEKRVQALQRAVADRLGAVNAVASFYQGSTAVDRGGFRTFVTPLLKRYPDLQTLAWVPRVPATSRRSHEEKIRDEGFPKYTIRPREPAGSPDLAAQRGEYYPILFVEPHTTNHALFGLDLGTAPRFLTAIQQAIASRLAIAIVEPPLDDRVADPYMLYFLEPAWHEESPAAARSNDPPSIDGFILGIFRMESLVGDALAVFPPVGIDLHIAATLPGGGRGTVYTWPSRLAVREQRHSTPPRGPMHTVNALDVANMRWHVDCVPLPVYLARYRSWAPTETVFGGLVVTGLLVGYLLLLTGRATRVEQLVAERTRALAESEERFHRLIDNAGDAFFLHDQGGKILEVNPQACDSLGYTREELLSMTMADIAEDFIPRKLDDYSKRPTEEYPLTFEAAHRRKDGTTFPVEIRHTPLDVGGQRLILDLSRDITDRKRAEQSLHAEQRLLRNMLELHEQDRKLVAYEIHDGLAQQLAAAIYKFQAVHQLHDRDPEAAEELCDDAISLLRKAMAETRRLISGLRPPVLDESGVVPAINYLIAEQSLQDGPKIDFDYPANFPRLAAPLEIAVFRIVQESLTNACRYSKSENVRIELTQTDDRVRIDVQDWGVGFDLANVKGDHVGLRGIHERVELLGGSIAIKTAPRQGTRITAELPLVPQIGNGEADA